MKIFIPVIIILFAESLQAQWSTDPNNNLIVGYGLDPNICSDSAGGCYITYDYNSTSYPRWLALERLDKYGYKPWGSLKQILGELPEQSHAEIIEDGEGGVIVSYEDYELNWPSYTSRIRVQKVDSNGNFLWGTTGVKVTLDDINQGSQKIVNDGEGGAVVVWVNTLAEYKLNRISSDGQRNWGDSGIVAGINGWYDPALLVRTTNNKYVVSAERNKIKYFDENGNVFYTDSVVFWLSNLISDGKGGTVLNGKVWNGMIPKLVAQRKDSIGSNLWQEPYIEIADSLHINTMLSIIQYGEYYFYGWMGKKNGNSEILQIQGLRSNGTLLFNRGSISLNNNPGVTTFIPIVPSDSASCIFISSYANGTFGQKIDTLGLLKWNPNQVLLNYPQFGLDHSFVTTDCIGGAIGLGVYLTDFTIPVFKVSAKGILGEIITYVSQEYQEIFPLETILYQNYPNPFNPTTTINFSLPEENNVKLKIYNTLGQTVAELVNSKLEAGQHSYRWDAKNYSSGIYFYELKTDKLISIKKMILIK